MMYLMFKNREHRSCLVSHCILKLDLQHANLILKGSIQVSNLQPFCCDATVQTTVHHYHKG